MQLTAVEVGRIDWVSHWFENSSISDETCRPGNELTTWPWKDSNCRIGRDSSDDNSIVLTEMRRQKRMPCDA
jgi:hypothetical protein